MDRIILVAWSLKQIQNKSRYIDQCNLNVRHMILIAQLKKHLMVLMHRSFSRMNVSIYMSCNSLNFALRNLATYRTPGHKNDESLDCVEWAS